MLFLRKQRCVCRVKFQCVVDLF
ncbi:MAG: DUF3709 domain-containing protein [Clostridia bacterium]|nr:DUF3709 domain-containing protein [Clostridia bacterium]